MTIGPSLSAVVARIDQLMADQQQLPSRPADRRSGDDPGEHRDDERRRGRDLRLPAAAATRP